jgi:alkylated DNA repair dioxygenase AlkB
MRIEGGPLVLELGGQLWLYPNWLAPPEADELFRQLRQGVPWSQGTLHQFGREVLEPRLSAWFGDADYTYSGRTLRSAPLPPPLASLCTRVERAAGTTLNAVLVNLYRDGRDSMGMHSDDEPELGANPVVASVSLGETRRFVLEPKKKSARAHDTSRRELLLGHGALLVMSGGCQHHYRHGVPKEERCQGERINLTFRRVFEKAADD